MKLAVLAAGLGSRLREESGGRPKQLLAVGGRTILDRAVELARGLGAEPLVVTRPEIASAFQGVEVVVEEAPSGLLGTLYHAREHLREDFCWIAGDLLFTDPAPLKELVEMHREHGSSHSFFYCRTDRFKLKVRLGLPVEVVLTREPGYSLSVPNFHVCSPRIFPYMAPDPQANYLQRMIAVGEPVLCREYTAPVFEIDTPEDLAAARRFYGE